MTEEDRMMSVMKTDVAFIIGYVKGKLESKETDSIVLEILNSWSEEVI